MKKKCLVADNNLLYLEFFSDVLSSFGYEVSKANDGLEALDIAREGRFDLFVLDFVMPKIDGMRLARYLKAMQKYKNVPVILVTAAALESVKWDEHSNFADIFVAKAPFEKMKEIFAELLPNLEKLRLESGKKVLGLDNIYPRQIVKELLRSELNHSAIFQNLVEGVIELDEHGKVIFANSSFCKIMGMEEDNAIGLNVSQILSFQTRPELKDCFEKILSAGKLKRESVVVNVGDMTIHLSFYNIFDSRETFSGSFVILQDITGVKKKIAEIGSLFNITQAFLSNLPYKNVLEYVTYEMRRLVKATNITLLLSCEGVFKGETVSAVDRKLESKERKKIVFWVDKINEWKKDGLVNLKSFSKINRVRFDNLPILWFPLVFQNRYLGTLLGFKTENNEFDEEETRFFEAVGNQIAVYVSNIEFFSRAMGTERDIDKMKLDVDSLTKTQSEDIFNQNSFLKWEERNKKIIGREMTEDMARSLTTLKGYIKLLEKEELNKNVKNKKAVMKNMTEMFNRLDSLREDINLLSKLGGDSELKIFSIKMLIAKIVEDIKPFNAIEVLKEIPAIQRLGDFEKLAFGIRMLLCSIAKKGGENLSLSFETCNDALNMILSFRFGDEAGGSIQSTSAERLFSAFSSDKWEELDNSAYYFFWQLKSLMSLFNGGASYGKQEGKSFIMLTFPAYNTKGERYEKI